MLVAGGGSPGTRRVRFLCKCENITVSSSAVATATGQSVCDGKNCQHVRIRDSIQSIPSNTGHTPVKSIQFTEGEWESILAAVWMPPRR